MSGKYNNRQPANSANTGSFVPNWQRNTPVNKPGATPLTNATFDTEADLDAAEADPQVLAVEAELEQGPAATVTTTSETTPETKTGTARSLNPLQESYDLATNTTVTNEPQVQRIAMVKLGDVFIDRRYQRPLNQKKVAAIAMLFDPAAAGFIVIHQREDGTLALIDGQHRLVAAQLQPTPYTHWPAVIHTGWDLKQEARSFANWNSVRATPARLNVFRAKLIAGEEDQLAITQIVKEEGFEIAEQLGGYYNKDRILAVGALEQIYGCYDRPTRDTGEAHPDDLRTTLQIVKACWPTEPEATGSRVLKGVALFHSRYRGQYDRARLVRMLQRTPMATMLQTASSPGPLFKAPAHVNFARAMLMIYNTNMRWNRLPDRLGNTGATRGADESEPAAPTTPDTSETGETTDE